MKGTIFVKPIEYSIIANGEKWRQGEELGGCLKIKNHGLEAVEFPFITLSLEVGNFKKIKAKDKKAWTKIELKKLIDKTSLEASAEIELPWSFTIPEDCQITEKDKSVYLTFFACEESWPTGLLELVIEPKLVMLKFLEIFENFLRFKVVQIKYVSGMVEIKMKPPASKELSHVETLVLKMREVNSTLELEYNFNMHAFEFVAGNMIAQKKIKQVSQTLSSKQYYTYGDAINHDFVIASLSGIIKEATPRFNLPS